MVGNITGNQNPLVGTTYPYEINVPGLLGGLGSDFEWQLYKKQKTGSWKDITGKPKSGKKVTYKFGEIALGIEFQIKVYEIKQGILPGMSASKQLAGTLTLIPTSNKVPKIDKVVLFNRAGKDVNKANYRDTLTAQAHCIAMFNEEIEFHLWEDDSPGKGHDPVINKNNRHTRSYKARVNEKGIAEARIPLMSDEKILRQIANQYLMKGDRDEGANHEYYVTATYSGKIQGASQVNVDVTNPDYKKGQPQSSPQSQPKPQPQKDTPKFPAGQGGGTKQPDPKGNIIEALFVDDAGKELSKVTVGKKIHVRIHSKNMVGKHIQYVVWEYDTGSHDEVYRSANIKIPADVCDTSGFVITPEIFKKGIDLPVGDPDAESQHYYIEIISKDLSAESKKFGVDSEGLLEVEQVKSAAVVQKQPEPEKKKDDNKCPRCKNKITLTQIENLFGIYSKHRNFRQEIIDNLNKYIFDSGKEIHIDTCLRKAHFFAQVGAETLGINPDWMVETDIYGYSKNRCFEVFGDRAKNLNAMGQLENYCSDKPQKRLLNYLYAHENGFGNGNGNEASGEGYIYRGRGLKQLTGKDNYRNASQYIKEYFPNEYINLIDDPDKVKTAKYAVLTAIAYWEKHEIWKTADTLKNSSDENIKKIRKLVNPGLAGWKDAKAYFEKGIDIFQVNNCTQVEKEKSKAKGEWHDPIDYSQRTYYNSSGVHKEQNGAFGPVRSKIIKGKAIPKNHQGLDIFADINTPCKACLDGKIVSYTNEGSNGYGNVLVLEVNGDDLRKAKRDYKLEFSAEKEIGSGFNINAEKFYLRYAHLKSAVKTNGKVNAGEIICYSGDTGNANGVPNPHLHFEIAMNPSKNGSGLTNRYNPAFFVRLKPIIQKTQDDVKKARTKK